MKSQLLERRLLEVIRMHEGIKVDEVIEKALSLGVKKHQIAKALFNLNAQGIIALEDPSPPENLVKYAFSLYSLWFWLLLMVIALTLTSIYLIPQIAPFIYLRYMMGALFILYLPGYSLIEALYPKREDLQPLERLALSIGLSLALIPLVGLILNYTPWGIRLNPIVTALTLLTFTLSLAALARKYSYFKLTRPPSKP